MMPLMPVPLVVLTPGTGNDYDINTAAGDPPNAVRVEATFNSNRGSSATGTPAVRTGTTWKAGSQIYIKQNAVFTGASGSGGSTGSPGSPGSPGSTGSTGSPGSTGSTGSPGTPSTTPGSPGGAGPGTLSLRRRPRCDPFSTE